MWLPYRLPQARQCATTSTAEVTESQPGAAHVLALGRMSWDERTREYVLRRTAEGKSKREILRCLKRYAAREIYRTLTATPTALSPPLWGVLTDIEASVGASERDEWLRAAWRVMVASATEPERLVFVDEMGTNTSLAPLYAWSRRGQRALCSAPRNWGANVTLLASMSLSGIGPSLAV